MTAAIVLHGMFLLWCHQDKTCDIIVPHTMMSGADVHNYTWGTLDISGKLQLNTIPVQDTTTIGNATMKLGTSELAAASVHPFRATATPGPYENYQFTLDGSKLKVNLNSTAVRNVIHIPWPDHVIGANRALVSSSVVAPNATHLAAVKSPAVGGMLLFSETVVLVYKNGNPFSFASEKSAPVGKSAAAGAVGAVIVLESWPGIDTTMDHSSGVNGALQFVAGGAAPTFQFTAIQSGLAGGSETALPGLNLPSPVTDAPVSSLRSSVSVSKDGNMTIYTVVKTGCGMISIEDLTQ